MQVYSDPAFVITALALAGLVVGSFLNVCIYRMPLGKSIVTPRSACPSCATPISALDNIPVLSYLILRGRCRKCGVHISMRYPLVEALNAALFVLIYLRTGMGWHLPVYLAFASAMVVVTFIDLDHQIIPDEITVPGVIIAFLAGAFILPDPFDRMALLGWKHSLIGAATGFGLFYFVAWAGSLIFKQDAMGGGDIKLMALVGALTGWRGVLLTTFIGSLTGSIIGISVMKARKHGPRMVLPFGPFLALGALVSILWGGELLRLWWPEQ